MGVNDELDESERAELHSRITMGARSLSAQKTRRSRLAAGAAAVLTVGIIVGASALALTRPVTPTIAESPSPSTVPSPSVTPTPTPPPSVAPSPTLPPSPVPVAGGSCDAVIRPSDVPSAVGPATVQDVTGVPLHTLGALSCRWLATWDLRVELFPAGVVPAAFTDRYATEQCESIGYDGYGCRVARATESLWALVTVGPGADTYGQDIPAGLLDEVADVIGAGLSKLAPGVPVEPAGWDAFTGCDDLGDALGLASVLGDASVTDGVGTDGSTADPAGMIAAAAGAVIGPCAWSTETDETSTRHPAIWVTVYPGGADAWDRLVGGATTGVDTTVAGADDAVIIDNEDQVDSVGTGEVLTRLYVNDGESIVVLSSRELARDPREVAADLLAAR